MSKTAREFEIFRQALGRRIQKIRKDKKHTQESLAESSGLDRVAVGYIEQGRRSPKLSTLYLLAKSLNVEVAAFFKRDR
ncbi:MAG: helix-turn-helix domain-containing protein [Candidatus Margulisbacteria bacterium]|jgi:transcriptional regulator with XRE-family HTH domain|nr:helix-turn-helix domain-containing protein [Candidatus Margulisiibacteriota bacterium]